MPHLGVSRVLPFRSEQLFDLVADVERYPQFLPGWISARILRREGDVYDTDQVIGLGPIRQRFRSRTVLRRPDAIEVAALDGPFDAFQLSWRFEPLPPARCRLALAGELALRGPLRHVLGRLMAGGFEPVLAAFAERARRLHGAS